MLTRKSPGVTQSACRQSAVGAYLGGVTGTVAPLWTPLLAEPVGALLVPDALPLLDAPGKLLSEVGPPEVSAVGFEPLKPLLPPPRLSGAEGVRTSTPSLGVPASLRPLDLLPEPMAAGLLPGFDSLRLSQALSPSTTTRIEAVIHGSGREQFANGIEVGLLRALELSIQHSWKISDFFKDAANYAHR